MGTGETAPLLVAVPHTIDTTSRSKDKKHKQQGTYKSETDFNVRCGIHLLLRSRRLQKLLLLLTSRLCRRHTITCFVLLVPGVASLRHVIDTGKCVRATSARENPKSAKEVQHGKR